MNPAHAPAVAAPSNEISTPARQSTENAVRTHARGEPPVFAFNGDADGLCALQQLRLEEGGQARLITGVKRDIALLSRVEGAQGEHITALDISHHENREDVRRLLACGAVLRYFDHHFSGDLPNHPHFTSHIDTAPNGCTSTLVNRWLGGRHVDWAIVAAFGDALPELAQAMADQRGLGAEDVAHFAQLGQCLNYNAYGESIADLHFDPAWLAQAMLPFRGPREFIRETDVLPALLHGYEDDMRQARLCRPERESAGAALFVLPPADWSRRSSGVLANELARAHPAQAIAILTPRRNGAYVASVRVPQTSPMSADAFCRQFETGGGRARAAGINHLPATELDVFAARFELAFGARVEFGPG